MINKVDFELKQISDNFLSLREKSYIISQIAQDWIDAIESGNKIIFCGNGGSAADSQHLAAELVGKYKLVRNPLPALSLTVNASILTAVSNDYGFDYIFYNQIKALGKKGDILVGISTSGNSKNVIEAFKIARDIGIKTIAFTGQDGGKLIKIADIALAVPSNITNYIQEMHIATGHIICDIVENYFFNKNRNL